VLVQHAESAGFEGSVLSVTLAQLNGSQDAVQLLMLLPGMLNSLALSQELGQWELRLGRPLISEELRLLILVGKLEPVADGAHLYSVNGSGEMTYEHGLA
jgi:hypothetical protein